MWQRLCITQLGGLAWFPGLPECPHGPTPHTNLKLLVLLGRITQTGLGSWVPQRHFKVEVSIIELILHKGHRKGAW